MIYAKVDVKLRDHVRAHKAGAAMSTWLWALLYAREQETDGIIPGVALRLAWAGAKDARRHADVLVAVGLWEAHEDGWRICRYDVKNETRVTIEERRRETRERVSKFRRNVSCNMGSNALPGEVGEVGNAVTNALVPGSGSGSGSGSDLKISRGDPRGVGSDSPPWFETTCDTVQQSTGATFDRRAAWLRYQGHRAANAKPMSAADAQYWLTTVDVREAAKDRQAAAEKREREARWDRDRQRQRDGPELPPKPTPAESKAFAAELVRRVQSGKGAA